MLYVQKTPRRNSTRQYTGRTVGDWYTIGLALGLGIALGTLFAGLLSATPLGRDRRAWCSPARPGRSWDRSSTTGRSSSPVWSEACSAPPPPRSSSPGRCGAGGTRGGLALIVATVAAGLAGLAFVPVVGYLEAVALPFLAVRLRRTQAERYAGLRTLAKD